MVHFKNSCGCSIVSKSCNLCLLEKLIICNFKEKDSLLNNGLDLVSKCQQESKYMLMNYIILYIYTLDIVYICSSTVNC